MIRSDTSAVLAVLPVLVALADTGQVTGAADVLGVPQPTVTRALQRAGREIGAELYEKDGRGVRLSAAGETLLPYAREALRRVEAGISAMTVPLHGRLSIAFQSSLGEDVVPALVDAFLSENPGIDISLAQGSRRDCLELLGSWRVDVAFVSPPPESVDIVNIDLVDDELVVVVPATHRLARRKAVRLGELAEDRFVMMASGFGLRSQVQSMLTDSGVDPDIAFEGQNIHTLVGLVSTGLGVAIVPRRKYRPRVVQLEIRGGRAERRIVMSRLVRRDVSATVQAFRTLAEERGSAIAKSALLVE
jgi:DNA-binding transcriptional LysR family regulator